MVLASVVHQHAGLHPQMCMRWLQVLTIACCCITWRAVSKGHATAKRDLTTRLTCACCAGICRSPTCDMSWTGGRCRR